MRRKGAMQVPTLLLLVTGAKFSFLFILKSVIILLLASVCARVTSSAISQACIMDGSEEF
jgi:hypothetical protein